MPETENRLSFEVNMKDEHPGHGYAATADVKVGGILTIRNVKVKAGDYGELLVVMPRTRMPHTGELKDSILFDSKETREKFDAAVTVAYDQLLNQYAGFEPEEEAEGCDTDEDMDEDMDEEDAPDMGMEMQ